VTSATLSLPARITSFPVVLRPFAPVDAARVTELCGDREIARMTAVIAHPYLPGMAEAWIATHAQERDVETAWNFAITRVDDGLLVGAIGLFARPDARDSFGYWVGRPFWRMGYATAACRAIVALAFTRQDRDELHATHLARNPASGRVMEKCGLTLARHERKPHRGGPLEDFCVWSITREHWSTLRGTP
jgi:ribosomal-protein-alanine N-acetyltransferase